MLNKNTIFPTINESSTWIMNCSVEQVINICNKNLSLIDDLQQTVQDSEYPEDYKKDIQSELVEELNKFEILVKKHKNDTNISTQIRNEIRINSKYILKTAMIFNHPTD